MEFGKKMKDIRIQKKISQRELGKRLGVSQQTIAQYERAVNVPKMETIQKIAEALEVTPADLYGEELTHQELTSLFSEELEPYENIIYNWFDAHGIEFEEKEDIFYITDGKNSGTLSKDFLIDFLTDANNLTLQNIVNETLKGHS